MRKVVIFLLMVFVAVGAIGQTPMKVSAGKLVSHVAHVVPPSYPVEAKEAHVSGTVTMRVVVSPKGDVTEVKAVSGPTLLRGEAVSVVKQWTYKPFMKNGKAVAVTGDVSTMFTLGSDASPGPDAHPGSHASMTPAEKFADRALPKYDLEPGLGERGFSCEVELAWRELPRLQLAPPDSPTMKWLETTRIRVYVKPMGKPEIGVKLPGEPKLKSAQLLGAKQALVTGGTWIQGFTTEWYSYALTGLPLFNHARLKKAGDTTEIVDAAYHGIVIRYVFDKNLLLTQILMNAPKTETTKISPKFEKAKEGLWQKWRYMGNETTVEKAGHEKRVVESIRYQNLGRFYLPKVAAVPVSGGSILHLTFQDCKVNPKPKTERPIRVNKNTVLVPVRPQ